MTVTVSCFSCLQIYYTRRYDHGKNSNKVFSWQQKISIKNWEKVTMKR